MKRACCRQFGAFWVDFRLTDEGCYNTYNMKGFRVYRVYYHYLGFGVVILVSKFYNSKIKESWLP